MTEQHAKNNDRVLSDRNLEQLRQARETFEQYKVQQKRWAILQLVVGYAAIVVLVGVVGICGYVLYKAASFPHAAVIAAVFTLLGDIMALAFGIWRIVLSTRIRKFALGLA